MQNDQHPEERNLQKSYENKERYYCAAFFMQNAQRCQDVLQISEYSRTDDSQEGFPRTAICGRKKVA
jgi:hypothetical protein